MANLVLSCFAATLASAGVALFFYKEWILERERRRHDRAYIRYLRAMVRNRDLLSDPDAVERVLDAFERPGAVAVPAGAGDGDGGGAGGPVA